MLKINSVEDYHYITKMVREWWKEKFNLHINHDFIYLFIYFVESRFSMEAYPQDVLDILK